MTNPRIWAHILRATSFGADAKGLKNGSAGMAASRRRLGSSRPLYIFANQRQTTWLRGHLRPSLIILKFLLQLQLFTHVRRLLLDQLLQLQSGPCIAVTTVRKYDLLHRG